MPAPALRFAFAILLALSLIAAGCAPRGAREDQPSVHYTVREGDTVTAIAARFDIDAYDIVKANHLRGHEDLVAGQDLILPGVTEAQLPLAAPTTLPTPPPVTPATDWYVPRTRWAVQQINVADTVPMGRVWRVTVHHSGEESDVVLGDDVSMLRHIEKIHTIPHGTNPAWACIGYHFVITPDGKVFEGRPLKYQGAHAQGDNNIGNIGICLIGDFDRGPVPSAQRVALVATLDRLTADYAIPKSQVFGHREFKPTECPGRYLMAIVEEYRGTGSGQVAPESPAPKPSTKSSKKKASQH
jgi:LysM repeat protein